MRQESVVSRMESVVGHLGHDTVCVISTNDLRDILDRYKKLEALLRVALPFIDDAMDAHSIMSESAATEACRRIVAEIRSECGGMCGV